MTDRVDIDDDQSLFRLNTAYANPGWHSERNERMSQPSYYPQPQFPQPPYGQPPMASATDPGLKQPWYGIGFMPAVTRAFKKYADFSGRASRGEYWWFYLATAVIGIVISILMMTAGMTWSGSVSSSGGSNGTLNGFGTFMMILSLIFGFGIIVPQLAVAVRRLHDANKPGAMWFVCLIPFGIGAIWLIILLATPTYPGPTQWDNPPDGASGYNPGYAPAPGYPAAPPAYPAAPAPVYPTPAYPQAQPPAAPYQGYPQ